MRLQLPLLDYQPQLKIKHEGGKGYIWDSLRAKYVRALPEELVRQLLVAYLCEQKGYKNHLAAEKQLLVNGQAKRFDLLAYNQAHQPAMLIECKSANVALNQQVFEQVAAYNAHLKLPFLLICNGLETICARLDFSQLSYEFLPELPHLSDL